MPARHARGRARHLRHASGPTPRLPRTSVRPAGAALVLTLGLGGGLGLGAVTSALGDTPDPKSAAEPTPSSTSTRSASTLSRSGTRLDLGGSNTGLTDPHPDADPTPTSAAEPGSGLLGTALTGPSTGVFAVATGEVPPPGAGTVRTVRIEVEQGLPVDTQVFADAVMATLNDPRGWSVPDGITFARTEAADASLRVVLASPDTVDKMCAPLNTEGEYSCGVTGAAVLNFTRWAEGGTGDDFPDVASYRQYLVNHEVGHVLGHQHVRCPGPGQLAPVMVQQSGSARGCIANGWPNPTGT